MQPFNSNIYKELEEVLQEVLVSEGSLALPYFGLLRYHATTIQQDGENLHFKRNVVTFEEDVNTSIKKTQVKTIADRLILSEFESKVVLNRWLGNIKSALRTNTGWSSTNFGEISSTENGIQVHLSESAFNTEDQTYFGFASVSIPKPLLGNSEITNSEPVEENEDAHGKIIPIDRGAKGEQSVAEKVADKRTNQPVQTSARALAASYILGVITLSLFSFEGNRVGSPVYNLIHPVQQTSQNIHEIPDETYSPRTEPEDINSEESAPAIVLESVQSEEASNSPTKKLDDNDKIQFTDKPDKPKVDAHHPEVYVVLGSYSQKDNAKRAIKEFSALDLAKDIEYKFNGTYYRVGLHVSEDEWHRVNQKHGLPFWILQ